MRAIRARARRVDKRLLLGALPLASGAALLVHVFAQVSLGLTLLAAGVIVALAAAALWARLPPSARAEVARRVRVGALAGLLATVAYDGVRWVVVNVFHYTFWPFDIYPIFGHAIGGADLAGGWAIALGVLYHYLNGVAFAVAYTILFGATGWWAGILWALGLEALMLGVYPGWLHPRALGEFVSVSMIGHLAYGSVLGGFGRWRLRRPGPAPTGASRASLAPARPPSP